MKNIVGHFDSLTHKRFFGNGTLNQYIIDLIKDFRSKRNSFTCSFCCNLSNVSDLFNQRSSREFSDLKEKNWLSADEIYSCLTKLFGNT